MPPWMPGAVTLLLFIFNHLPLLFNIYLYFFLKTPSLGVPGWIPGVVAPTRTPICTALGL